MREVELSQYHFESDCGNDMKNEGQDIMAFTAIAQFYSSSDGFGSRRETAKRIYNAIKSSQCSGDIKWLVDKVVSAYELLRN